MEIQWKRGDYRTFFAQMKIRVGGKDTLDIQKGDEFEYDGTIVKYAGAEFPQPGLRGAIKEGWATLTAQSSAINAVRPERSMAKAQSVSREFSRIQRNSPTALTATDDDENIVMDVSDRESARKSGGHVNKSTRRIASLDVDTQEGEVVARVRSSTKVVADVTKTAGLANKLEDISFEGGYGRADGSVGKRSTSIEGISVSTNMEKINTSEIQSADVEEGVVVGKIRTSTKRSEGDIMIKDTSGTPGKVVKPSVVKTVTVEAEEENGNSKLDMARSVYPSFPEDWNFFAKPEDKMKRVKELGNKPEFVKALYAAEGKKMRKTLQAAYSFLK